jgi:hypothetical protein
MTGDTSDAEGTDLLGAFPSTLRSEAATAISLLPAAQLGPLGRFTVRVDGEPITIPYRIYNPEPNPSAVQTLTNREQLMLRCLLSRHPDGWVRQRNLESLVTSEEIWVVPFVVQLVGEYVIEILDVIWSSLIDLDQPGSTRSSVYGRFLKENPAFLDLTAARVTSYWACYYRSRYLKRAEHPNWTDYPGFQLVDSLRLAAGTPSERR